MKRLFTIFLMLASVTAPAIAGSGVAWGGVGWYLKYQGSYQGATPVAIGGPYADRPACEVEAARARNDPASAQGNYWCNYETVAWASPDYDS